jgi:isohexenylglutaconyl-CoA hydratase
MSAEGAALFHQLKHQPQPTIALVDGAALAGGLGLVCCVDFVVVTHDAKFALTEVHLGIPPAQIAPYLVDRLGLVTAKKLMLSGRTFGGEEALALGLADRLCTHMSDLERYENDLRGAILKGAPGAITATKALILAPREDYSQRAGEVFADCLFSEEGREGMASFLEKRKPQWSAS